MDYDKVGAADFGGALSGLGLNILVCDVLATVALLRDVFGMEAFQPSADFAIMKYGEQVFQLHSDAIYHSHPLPSLLPEAGPRGGGIELRLYNSDPDQAALDAENHVHQAMILQGPTNKPHGLRECVILCENGYAWLPSRPLRAGES